MRRVSFAVIVACVLHLILAAPVRSQFLEEARRSPDDAMDGDGFGSAASLAGDTAVVAARASGQTGTVYVLQRGAGGWTFRQPLRQFVAVDTNRTFGADVSVDGDTAAIGAPDDSGAGSRAGAVYVYRRDETGEWGNDEKLSAPDASRNRNFGFSVSLSGDTLLVGSPSENPTVEAPSAAYVYIRSDSGWSFHSRLEPTDVPGTNAFGYGVALDGDVAFVGDPHHDVGGPRVGAVSVFRRNGERWLAEQRIVTGSPSDLQLFGQDVAVSGDTLVVAAPGNTDLPSAVWVFRNDAVSWEPERKFPMPRGGGLTVDVDGDVAVVGAQSALDTGFVRLLRKGKSAWSLAEILKPVGLRDGSYVGAAVAIDGDRIVAGATGACPAGLAVFYRACGGGPDCDHDGISDDCGIATGASTDCDADGVPDSCDIRDLGAADCNDNGVPDSCEIREDPDLDCDGTDALDECEIASGVAADLDRNGVPDICDAFGIFENGRPSDRGAREARRVFQADDFALPVRAAVQRVRVWAGERRSCQGWDGTVDFLLLADSETGPGEVISMSRAIDVWREPAGPPVGGLKQFLYDVRIDPPVIVEAGVRYWVALHFTDDFGGDGMFWLGTDETFGAESYWGEVLRSRISFRWTPGGSSLAFEIVYRPLAEDCDAPEGEFADCNRNAAPDECEVASNAVDANGNGMPDECEQDCNANGVDDSLDLRSPIGFSAARHVAAGAHPAMLAIADFDGGAGNDLAVTLFMGGAVAILRNRGDGTFERRTVAAGDGPFGIDAADLDGDGFSDLAITNLNEDTLWVVYNEGDGSFGEPVILQTREEPRAVVAADLDGDRDRDLVVVNAGADLLSLYLNEGERRFSRARVFGFPGTGAKTPTAVVAEDFDLDGDLDLAVTLHSRNEVILMRNDDPGVLVRWGPFDVGEGPNALVAVDLDGDGSTDLAVANDASDSVSVLRGFRGLGFFPALTFDVGVGPLAIAAADLDGDGRQDLITANKGSADASILRNLGGLDFDLALSPAVESGAWSVGVLDVNGDNRPDLATTNADRDTVSVLPGIVDATSFDCDRDGVPDECDTDTRPSKDCNRNSVPDACEQDLSIPIEINLPLDAPSLRQVETSVRVGSNDVSISAPLLFTSRGRIECRGQCTVGGAPADSLRGVLKRSRMKGTGEAVWTYKLKLKNREERRTATLKGIVGMDAANVTYRGPEGRVRNNLVPVSQTVDFDVSVGLRLTLGLDPCGRLAAHGEVFGGFISDETGVEITGKATGGRLTWTLSQGKRRVTFKGTADGDHYVGRLSYRWPPAGPRAIERVAFPLDPAELAR